MRDSNLPQLSDQQEIQAALVTKKGSMSHTDMALQKQPESRDGRKQHDVLGEVDAKLQAIKISAQKLANDDSPSHRESEDVLVYGSDWGDPRQRSKTVGEAKPFDSLLKEIRYKKKLQNGLTAASKDKKSEDLLVPPGNQPRQRSVSVSFATSHKPSKQMTGGGYSFGSSSRAQSSTVSSASAGTIPMQSSSFSLRNNKLLSSTEKLKEKYLSFFRLSRAKSAEKVIGSIEKFVSSAMGSMLTLNTGARSTDNSASRLSILSDDDVPDPIELLARLSNTKKNNYWKSPVITDEFYIMEYLFDGDAEKAAKKLKNLNGINFSQNTLSSPSTSRSTSNSDLKTSSKRVSQELSSNNLDFDLSRKESLNVVLEEVSSTLEKQSQDSGSAISLNAYFRLEPNNGSNSNNFNTPATASVSKQGSENAIDGSGDTNYYDSSSRRSSLQKAPKLPKKMADKPSLAKLKSKSIIKFNSCSTLFTIDSTLFKPSASPKHLDTTLKAIAYAVSSHLKRTYALYSELQAYDVQNKQGRKYASKVFYTSDILSEKAHPIWKVRQIPDEVVKNPEIMQPPTTDELYQFLKQIFVAADLTSEVGIITLIYLERLMFRARVSLHGLNCFRAILGAVMLASKVWDDQAVWNVDFKSIMSDLRLRSLNYLERWWLRKIDFDTGIKRGQFATYWFAIREVAEKVWGVRLGKVELAKNNINSQNGHAVSQYNLSKKDKSLKDMDPNMGKTTLLMEPAFKETELRRKSRPDLNVVIPKPLTEEYMNKIAASSNYSQTKLRQTFSESLSAPINASSYSLFQWEDGRSKSIDYPRSSTQILNSKSKESSAKSSMSRTNTTSSDESRNTKPLVSAERDTTFETRPIQTRRESDSLKETIAGRLNTELRDFGWGGVNLRKSKSEDFYNPPAPAASVL